MHDLMGNSTEAGALEKIWRDSLQECKAHLDRITFEDFKRLMKGQPKEKPRSSVGHCSGMFSSAIFMETSQLGVVPETVPESQRLEKPNSVGPELESMLNLAEEEKKEFGAEERQQGYKKKRSRSYEQKGSVWDVQNASMPNFELVPPVLDRDASRALVLPSRDDEKFVEARRDSTVSPLLANRALYRKHREMRLAVLEASKQFDLKRNEIQNKESYPTKAGLIMRRGAKPPVELEDAHQRALFEAAAKRCGRARRTRNKTKSDVTGMMLRPVAAS